MVTATRAWALEQNDRRLAFAAGTGTTMFADTGPFAVTRHRHPAWKVVLPVGGDVTVATGGGRPLVAPGIVVPPQLAHACAAASPYVTLFVDAWLLPSGVGLRRLEAAEVRRLLAALGATGVDDTTVAPDLAAARAELMTLTGGGGHLDPRVLHALRTCPHREDLSQIAGDVGLSPARLRALVRASVGIPLARLRRWARLKAAVATLAHASVADAAATAGFADQAHLTRTARDLIGRTPRSLRP
ncbi:helix-turn-helix domain-containing protein [Streptosporangium sp. NPDC000396]|uniref:helix-turn-helix domain-containing protein n=1 Tax=Streptosporangium sp. NPDC000396 TaxID=3366185 RepID=UPI0036C47488